MWAPCRHPTKRTRPQTACPHNAGMRKKPFTVTATWAKSLIRAGTLWAALALATLGAIAPAVMTGCVADEPPPRPTPSDVLGLPGCDDILISNLLSREHLGTAAEINHLISLIQEDVTRCTQETWDPRVRETPVEEDLASSDGESGPPRRCFQREGERLYPPTGTFDQIQKEGAVAIDLGGDGFWRGRDNHVVVEFEEGGEPSTLARCWIIQPDGLVWEIVDR